MAWHECTQKENIESIKTSVEHNGLKVDHIEKTLYQGNGKMSMVAQLAVIELKITTLDGKIDTKFNALKAEIDNIKGYGRAIILAVLSMFGATIWQMIQKHNAETYDTFQQHATVAKWINSIRGRQ